MAAGSIIIDLLMRTASFETDSKRAEKRLRELKEQTKELATAMGTALAAGAVAMTYALKQSIDAMDETSKAAQKIGMATESLSALQYAADMSGVSTEALQSSMAKLAKQAADGNDAFAAMGINVKDAQGNLKTTDKLLEEIAAKFATYRDGAEKTALAQEIFGKSGADMIPLLNAGASGIAEMTDEAKQLGLVMDTETGKAAEAFNDNLARLQKFAVGIANNVAADLLPSLQGLSEEFVDGAKNSGAMDTASRTLATGLRLVGSALVIVGGVLKAVGTLFGNTVAFLVDTVSRGVATAASQINGIGEALLQAAKGNFSAAGKALSGVVGDTADFYKQTFSGAKIVIGDFASDVSGTINALGAIWDESAKKATATANSPGGGIAAPIVAGAEKSKKAKAEIDKAAKEAEAAMKRMVDEGNRLTESMMTPFEKMQASKANTNKLAGAGVITPETQSRALTSAQKTYDDFIRSQKDALSTGLLSEEQEIRASYERRRQEILTLTEVTENDRQDALAALAEKRDKDLAAAQLSRYKDLLDEREVLTIEYAERRKEIENDESLSYEQKTQFKWQLEQDLADKLKEMDEADAKKRQELMAQQVQLVTDGFAGMAEIAKVFAGEQSGVYAALFTASKAFALADITVKQSQAIAKAWAENNYWVAAGLTVGLAAQFAGLVSSVQSASFGGTRADGGPVNAGRSYLVGERGPEMFTPGTSGRITSNDMLQPAQSSPQIRIVNAFDDGHIDDYMGSDSAERKVLNIVRRNRRALGMA